MTDATVTNTTVTNTTLANTTLANTTLTGLQHWTQIGSDKIFLAEKQAVTGQARGTILLVHGSSMGSQAMDLQIPGDPDASQMDWFARHGFNVWRFDCRGYGRSDKPAGHMATVAEGSDDILAVSDYIAKTRGIDQLMMTGVSSGALRAALFAQRHPERVKRLALSAFVWTGQGSPTLAKRSEKLAEWLKEPRRKIRAESVAGNLTRDHSGATKEEWIRPLVDAVLAVEDSVPNGTYIDMCSNLPLVDPTKILVPTAILRGEHDGVASMEDVVNFFLLLPNGDKELVMLPGLSHNAAMAKNYLRFYDAMLTFFSRPTQVFRG